LYGLPPELPRCEQLGAPFCKRPLPQLPFRQVCNASPLLPAFFRWIFCGSSTAFEPAPGFQLFLAQVRNPFWWFARTLPRCPLPSPGGFSLPSCFRKSLGLMDLLFRACRRAGPSALSFQLQALIYDEHLRRLWVDQDRSTPPFFAPGREERFPSFMSTFEEDSILFLQRRFPWAPPLL